MSIPAGRAVDPAHAASYRAREVHAPAPVVDGVWAVPVPLAGSALRSIIVYLVATSDGLVLIDAGYDHPSCWRSFQQSVADLGLRVGDITAVLVTHNHPDHVGFADRVRSESGARVMMAHLDDFAVMHATRGPFLTQLSAALAWTGAPADVVAWMYDDAVGVAEHHENLRLDHAFTEPVEDLHFGDVTIRAVHAPGHTYGHTVFHDTRGLVFTGDTMMAEGPTQLAIASRPDDDPAGDLFATLARIGDLGATIACPAHQFPYRDVAARAAELAAFHRAEVEAVREVATLGDTAWTVARRLTWKKPWDELGRGTRRFHLVHTLALMRAA
ncbi:MBL fold metallo-hydrolase [Virgisporangium ochraceum]|uniref:MBL fold metallo-hydrolase n=1 Tax=Virgisporangium ochraceum TaxID=65505 RepID=A0A8J4A2J6_9ACTN|nr:MBL fold metallo-hydrolase [Virgisporangium ochraceum]GIJ72998.1 MBL fold metallo-hydrolase [Virgisporangium ochraceum]